MKRHYQTIEDIKYHNAETGHYFFSEGAMQFFASRVAPTLYGKDRNIFITSEKFDDDTERMYTVRCIDEDGQIQDLSEFQQFRYIKTAKKFINKITKKEEVNA